MRVVTIAIRLCAVALFAIPLLSLLASCGGPRAERGSVLLLHPHGKTAEVQRGDLARGAAARGFVVATSTPDGAGACFDLGYSCDLIPAHKREGAHVVLEATVTDLRTGTVRYRNRIVSSAPAGLDAATSSAEETLLDDIARLR